MSVVVKGYMCWRCGVELSEFRLPVSRRDECASCRAEIHVCKQCQYYDARIKNGCREDRAEDVGNKEQANFCDYYKPNADAYKPTATSKQEQARMQAEALFGQAKQESVETGNAIDDPAQAARDELKRLFGEDN